MTKSKVTDVHIDAENHRVTIEVTHHATASYRQSVTPCAVKEFKKFAKTEEGQKWFREGYTAYEVYSDYSVKTSLSASADGSSNPISVIRVFCIRK